MFNEETTAGIMVSEETEAIATYVRVFFQIMTMLVSSFKELYAYFFGK